jgi:tartronate-semialdehyde synthase
LPKAIRVKSPNEFKDAFARANALMAEFQVPVVIEFILEKVTNISMGAEVDSVNEFEDILCLDPSLSITKGQDMGVQEGGPQPASRQLEPAKG